MLCRRSVRPLPRLGSPRKNLAKDDMVMQLGVPPRRIDLLTSINGVAFEEAWARRATIEWRGHQIAFLGLDELLRNKKSTGRLKDQIDIQELNRLHKPKGE